MSDFISKLNALKNSLFDSNANEQPSTKSKAKPTPKVSQLKSNDEPRDPYIIQIGFDFGTSYSKCIYREVTKDKAWVACPSFVQGDLPFLLPSAICYCDGTFSRHDKVSVQYPADGLVHLKFAIEQIALNNFTAPVLLSYRKAIKTDSKAELEKFVHLCGAYYIGISLSSISHVILQQFPDYGANEMDQLAVNMAIPVADASNPTVSNCYLSILKTAWAIYSYLPVNGTITSNALEKLIADHPVSTSDTELFHVYPEVSANVQAFIKSPAAHPNEQTIYFFSDTGAGTVDQSVFTIASNKFNYFAAEVLPIGSSQIDLLAHKNSAFTHDREYWKQQKEAGAELPELNQAKLILTEKLKELSSQKTISAAKEKLPSGPGVSPLATLRQHTKIIFGGGGHTALPYAEGVIEAFRASLAHPNYKPRTTGIPTPPDLELSKQNNDWMRRLFVAYGLSFPAIELKKNTYPHENVLERSTNTELTFNQCSCRGISPNCPRCGGTGIY